MTPTTRERVLEVIKRLPAETSVEEAMERLYFLAEIEEGLRQVERGEVISHEEAKRRLLGRS
jgi:predicted transcriptional regulator